MKVAKSTNNKVHIIEWREGKPYYRCNHAVGSISRKIIKTGIATCKNCRMR